MRPLAIVNVERIDETPFLVTVIYGSDGQRLDEIIEPYEGDRQQAIKTLNETLILYGFDTIEVWTSGLDLFASFLHYVGFAASYKHRDDTVDTANTLLSYEDILCETYAIKPPLPKWKTWLIRRLQKIIKLIGG